MKKQDYLKGSLKELIKRRDDTQVAFRGLKKECGETKEVKFLRKKIHKLSREIERRKHPKLKKGYTERKLPNAFSFIKVCLN